MPESITLPFNPSPRLHDYTGLWFIQPEAGSAMLRMAKGMDWDQHAKNLVGSDDPRGQGDSKSRLAYNLHENGVAELKLDGTLMKHENSMETSTSTVFSRRALRQAAEDERVEAIVLRVDSPGGTVSGTDDLGAEIARIDQQKPVVAFAEDLMASAAYWIGSQARAIFANSRTALIGSIGTIMALYDFSEQAKQEGIEALVFATGELKGTGFPGAEVTEQQRAYLQELVDKNQVIFNDAIQRGRGLSAEAVEAAGTGGVWKAEDAQAMGLIDGIFDFDTVLRYAANLAMAQEAVDRDDTTTTTPEPPRSASMSTNPATVSQIKEACTGCDSEFVMSQLEAEASIEAAKTAYINTLAAKVQNRDEQIKSLGDEHKAKVDELTKQHAEALKAKDEELEQAKTDLANVQLGATDDDTTPASDAEPKSKNQSAFRSAVRVHQN